jgi:Domain of unknown function (DUF4440)
MVMMPSRFAIIALLLCLAGASHAAGSAMPASSSLLARLSAKENAFWAAFQKNDVAGFKSLVTDDYVNVDFGGGVLVGDEFFKLIPKVHLVDFKLSDFHMVQPTRNTVVLVNRAVTHFMQKGKPVEYDLMTSTVWVKRGGRWVASAYQETVISKG